MRECSEAAHSLADLVSFGVAPSILKHGKSTDYMKEKLSPYLRTGGADFLRLLFEFEEAEDFSGDSFRERKDFLAQKTFRLQCAGHEPIACG